MHLIKKLLSAVIPLSMVLSMPVMAREWAEIKSSGTLIAATEGAFAPFNYYEGKKLTGYEVDVAEAIAKKMGLKLEWRVVPFDAWRSFCRERSLSANGEKSAENKAFTRAAESLLDARMIATGDHDGVRLVWVCGTSET